MASFVSWLSTSALEMDLLVPKIEALIALKSGMSRKEMSAELRMRARARACVRVWVPALFFSLVPRGCAHSGKLAQLCFCVSRVNIDLFSF